MNLETIKSKTTENVVLELRSISSVTLELGTDAINLTGSELVKRVDGKFITGGPVNIRVSEEITVNTPMLGAGLGNQTIQFTEDEIELIQEAKANFLQAIKSVLDSKAEIED